MPTKQVHDDVPLTPAMTFWLMAGSQATARLHGWVAAAQAGRFGEPMPETVWAAHQDTLIAEAAAHGFQPFALTKRVPHGDGFTRWRDAFIRQHRY